MNLLLIWTAERARPRHEAPAEGVACLLPVPVHSHAVHHAGQHQRLHHRHDKECQSTLHRKDCLRNVSYLHFVLKSVEKTFKVLITIGLYPTWLAMMSFVGQRIKKALSRERSTLGTLGSRVRSAYRFKVLPGLMMVSSIHAPHIAVLGGRLSEIFGTKRVLLTSTVLSGILSVMSVPASLWSAWSLVVVRVTMGLVQGVLFPCINPMLVRLVGDRHTYFIEMGVQVWGEYWMNDRQILLILQSCKAELVCTLQYISGGRQSMSRTSFLPWQRWEGHLARSSSTQWWGSSWKHMTGRCGTLVSKSVAKWWIMIVIWNAYWIAHFWPLSYQFIIQSHIRWLLWCERLVEVSIWVKSYSLYPDRLCSTLAAWRPSPGVLRGTYL